MKYLLIILSLILFTGCITFAETSTDDGRITVVTTIFPLYDFARQVTGDNADVILLLPPSSDSHGYEATPRDIMRIREADVFLYIGGASDAWTGRVFADDELLSVRLMDSVSLRAGDNCGHYFDEYDEHIWTSPVNAILMTRAILNALCAADPFNANYYNRNAAEYIGQLEALDLELREIASSAGRNTLVFGDRFSFRYLTEEYDFDFLAAFPGCAELTEPSAMTLASLIEFVTYENIPVIFYGELSDKRIAESLSRVTGAEPVLLHSVHTVTQAELDAGIGYIELMTANIGALRKAML